MDIKSIDFETRLALENTSKVSMQPDGSVVILDSAIATWEYCAAAMFGKMIKDLSVDEKNELNALSKEKAQELGSRARVHYENPSQG